MPNIDMMVHVITGNLMFFFMDVFSDYNQIKRHPLDIKKTVFRTRVGNFHYTVMPLGLK